jgi:HlyD family secretion protein
MGNRFRRIAALSITGVVVAGGATAAYAAVSSSGPVYRLASVTSADVAATLQVVGTLTPVRQDDVAFAVGGSVASVAVRPGQHVTAGQTLGSLDTTSLKGDLTSAQSALATANLKVANDTASQNTTATTSATYPAARPTPSVRPQQQAVLSAQHTVDSALAQAKAALGQAKQACAAAPSPRPTAAPTVTAAATRTVTASPTATGTTHPVPAATPSPATCAGATQRVLDTETALLQAQQALSGQLMALNKALSSAAAAASKSPGGAGAGGGSGGGAGSGTIRGTGGSGSAGPVSAAQLTADQASADAAAAQLTVAQQNLAAATLVSPISGTVVTVSVTAGSSTSAGSTAFVIAGLDSYQVVTTVPVTDMPELKVGQRASVQPDGIRAPLSGSVASIGLVPATSGSTAYPVTIGLTGQPSGLHAGGYANVAITTGQSTGVSVPTSAVHSSGHVATVTVYAGGKTRITRVTVGTKGPVMTRITSGLKVGQQVVLADLSKPLPTNNLANQFPGPGGGPGFIGGPNFVHVH